MRSSFWVAFGMSAFFASVGLIVTDALAAYTRSFSVAACVPISGTNPATTVPERTADGQLANTTPNSSLVLACPVVSDTPNGVGGGYTVPWAAEYSNSAHLYGWSNGADGLQVEACRTYFGGWGGTCVVGPNSVSGINDLSFNPSSAWGAGSPSDGYWLKATVGPSSSLFSYTFGLN